MSKPKRIMSMLLMLVAFAAKSQIIVFTQGCYDAKKGLYTFQFYKTGEGVGENDIVAVTTNWTAEGMPVIIQKDGGTAGIDFYHYSVKMPSLALPAQISVYVNNQYLAHQIADGVPCPPRRRRHDDDDLFEDHHDRDH